MNVKDKDINELLEITVTGQFVDEVPHELRGIGDYRISIIGHENLQKLTKAVEAILKEDIAS